jgi:hypothetical protein
MERKQPLRLDKLVKVTDWMFPDSPDIGDPKCTCSRCHKAITEEHGVPIRVFNERTYTERRYHQTCLFPDVAPVPITEEEEW